MTMTHIHTYLHTPGRVHNTHIHLGARLLRISRSASLTYAHTRSGLLESEDKTYIHTPVPMLTLDCLLKHIYPYFKITGSFLFFTITERVLFYACNVTRNLRTYFTSVERVLLVKTVVLQTVLWDIRAWSAFFLSNLFIFLRLADFLVSILMMNVHNLSIYWMLLM